MREIVTLQLGELSNYAAAHFWNTQESYFTYSDNEKSLVDHNVHWRAGIGADDSETFLPRTVIYDLKGGFGSLRKINALYEAESESNPEALWSGQSVVHRQTPIDPSAYQQSLDAGTEPARLSTSNVRYWSDFSRAFFHPKSLVQLYDFELNSTTMPFERFSMGTELFSMLDKDHEIVDRDFRPFAEECDRLQGIQVFTTIDDAWGGFTSSYLESLRDEFPKTTIWTWGLQSPSLDISRAKRQLRLANTAHSIEQLCTQASTVVPLALPEEDMSTAVSIDRRSPWHTSALMAAAIETATLPSRLTQDSSEQTGSLDILAESLNVNGNQPLASMHMSLAPVKDTPEDSRIHVDFFQVGRTWSRQHIARLNTYKHVFGEILSCRDIDYLEHEDEDTPRYLTPGERPVIGSSIVRKYDLALRFPLLDAYPRIYPQLADHSDASVRTTLSTNSSMVQRIRTLRTESARLVPVSEREDLGNGLAELADAYQEGWFSGSDDDNDDL
ncbi:mtDNA inheritance, partitioning of the mitochondrial organelle [Fusarium equiseti]|uniref:MtDNA inheritance, partitioning of the mitochondrial organelle n=1 Tax=Fusarium equiseti TaxID=61235 RepID=A0ABQ8QZ63_FUSEQ|nr:mtDNA inheritance, partitioning of the mitochondrial organelle [Fusarium equiseti]